LERVCRVVPLESLHTALRCAARIDRMAKGLERGDVWDELLQLGLAVVPAGTAPVLSPARRIH
jgi:DNA polymerase-3 subunit delta